MAGVVYMLGRCRICLDGVHHTSDLGDDSLYRSSFTVRSCYFAQIPRAPGYIPLDVNPVKGLFKGFLLNQVTVSMEGYRFRPKQFQIPTFLGLTFLRWYQPMDTVCLSSNKPPSAWSLLRPLVLEPSKRRYFTIKTKVIWVSEIYSSWCHIPYSLLIPAGPVPYCCHFLGTFFHVTWIEAVKQQRLLSSMG